MKNLRRTLDYLWKLIAIGLGFSLATLAAGAIFTFMGMHAAAMPGEDPQKSMLITAGLSPLLALGLAPLAARLTGSYRIRWLALALLVFINLGLNTYIEANFFMTVFDKGGGAFILLVSACSAAAFAAVLARLFGPAAPETPAPALPRRGLFAWAWRGALAVLAFPVVYFIFGLMVAPFVLPTYRAGVAGLVVPPMSVILPVEFVRSGLSLLAALPVIFLWVGSRRRLAVTLGWALAVVCGLYGLIGAYWFPTVLRVAHSLEITADSFLYAFVIVMLLKARPASASGARSAPNSIEQAAA